MKTNKMMGVLLGMAAIALVAVVVILATRKNPTPVQMAITNPVQIPSPKPTPTSTPVSTPAAQISVPGMLKYVEKDLGYSFWYPNSWKVTETTNGVPPKNSSLSGGSVNKVITVGPSDGTPGGVVIQNFVSTGKTIADSTVCNSSDEPGCPGYVRYSFDSTNHLWMKKVYPADTNSPQDFYPADISVNTMGGLHIFPGNQWSGNDVIIPLSASHFLVVSAADSRGIDILPFANTIVALNPAVATPVTLPEQQRTILKALAAYAGS